MRVREASGIRHLITACLSLPRTLDLVLVPILSSGVAGRTLVARACAAASFPRLWALGKFKAVKAPKEVNLDSARSAICEFQSPAALPPVFCPLATAEWLQVTGQ